jgi:adenylate kinase
MNRQALPRRILLLGPPGSGKGTIGVRLAAELGVPHVSSGQALRATVAAGDPYGIGDRIAAGHFAPDELVAEVVGARLGDGFILDGYPRTVAQAEQLEAILAPARRAIQVVLELRVSDEVVRARLARRATLEGRADDTPDTVSTRLAIWHEELEPLRKYYADRLRVVDASGPVDEVVAAALTVLAGQYA